MLDKDTLRELGWGEELIDAVTRMAQQIDDVAKSIPDTQFEMGATTSVSSSLAVVVPEPAGSDFFAVSRR